VLHRTTIGSIKCFGRKTKPTSLPWRMPCGGSIGNDGSTATKITRRLFTSLINQLPETVFTTKIDDLLNWGRASSQCRGKINLHFVLVTGAAALHDFDAQPISLGCAGKKLADLFRGVTCNSYFSSRRNGGLRTWLHGSKCRRIESM